MTSAYAADPVFEANGKQISYLLQRIEYRELALPDFQRDFVWDAKATTELLRSIMSRFPAGTLLAWKIGEENRGFAARAVEGAPALNGKHPDELVLDGQQRLTALYRALTGTSDERFYVHMKMFLSDVGEVKQVHEVDFEKAMLAVDLSTRLKSDPENTDWQFENAVFPLARLHAFDEWLDRYARKTADTADEEDGIKRQMRGVRDAFLVPLRSYGFPVVTLPATTPLEAVCNIFETLNRTGKPLGAFDLVTARLYPRSIKLRDLWEEAQNNYSVLDEYDVDPYAILQAVSLRARSSAQRADVLTKLTAEDIHKHWQPVVSGAAAVLDLLRSEYGVLSKRWLPYGMLLVPMAAVWPEVRAMKQLQKSGAMERLSHYFWCTTFMTNYDQGANSQAGADFIKLTKWVADADQPAPEAVANFNVTESTLLQATVRRKALHAGVMALTIKAGAKDFYTGQKLTPAKVQEKKVDSHHVFPKGHLGATTHAERLLNRALVDSDTNKTIGKNAPSVYLARMREAHGDEKLTDVLESHAIEVGAETGLESDDYDKFLIERLNAITVLVEEAAGRKLLHDISDPSTTDGGG